MSYSAVLRLLQHEDEHDHDHDHDHDHGADTATSDEGAAGTKAAAEADSHDDHHDDHDDHEDMNVSTFKVIIAIAMFLCVGFGVLPKVWPRCGKNDTLLSMLNCFSAGLFLGMALIHIMPESVEIYASWAMEEGIEEPFPLPYVMFFIGYMLILAIDRVAAHAYHMKHDHGGKPQPNLNAGNFMQSEHNQVAEAPKSFPVTADDADASVNTERAPVNQKPLEMEDPSKPSVTVSKTSAIILVLALSAHAFFEGIAFGLQSNIEKAGQLAAGIIIHKSAAAVSLGASFARTGYSTKEILLFLGIFAFVAPIGIFIGMAIHESNKVLDVIFHGLSGGTFVYVACSEIITAEFDKGRYNWAKMLLVFAGGLVITLLWFMGGHNHDHGSHDDHSGHGH